jgi:hypothetical protein
MLARCSLVSTIHLLNSALSSPSLLIPALWSLVSGRWSSLCGHWSQVFSFWPLLSNLGCLESLLSQFSDICWPPSGLNLCFLLSHSPSFSIRTPCLSNKPLQIHFLFFLPRPYLSLLDRTTSSSFLRMHYFSSRKLRIQTKEWTDGRTFWFKNFPNRARRGGGYRRRFRCIIFLVTSRAD